MHTMVMDWIRWSGDQSEIGRGWRKNFDDATAGGPCQFFFACLRDAFELSSSSKVRFFVL